MVYSERPCDLEKEIEDIMHAILDIMHASISHVRHDIIDESK